ncbi:MAG: tetratricopeptide repeat protein [Bernardetiaceae bacterium]|nr:tetratricopeptide repeat protein [Bernardetiaceae bacterium]
MRFIAFIPIFLLLCLGSCQFYHNTTARFNAYFLAKERMKEVEQDLFGEIQDDYNNILYVFERIDSTTAASEKANLKYIIEKASLPIDRHETSKWVEPSYLVIGKARLYEADFRNAINTFKYVNTVSKNNDARHEALVWLLRSYTEAGQLLNVESLMAFIIKENRDGAKFNTENKTLFYLNSAHYYRIIRNFRRTAEYLELALPNVKNKKERARYHFIIAQIYQKEGNNEKAYENYQIAIQYYPNYDMTFNAQLNAVRVSSPNDPNAVKDMEKYFQKLLNDQKNTEFRDRIFYEMANFEIKKGKVRKGIEYLNASLQEPMASEQQKAYSYAKLGEVNYEYLRDFNQANNYYDSALRVLSKDAAEYKNIEKRAALLSEFATEFLKIERQDYWLAIAAMDEQGQIDFLEKEIQKEKLRIDEEIAREEERRKAQIRASGGSGIVANNPNAPKWYFTNLEAMQQGEDQFFREWGNRPLEDNWRRSNKADSQIDTEKNTDGQTATDLIAQETEDKRYDKVVSLEARLAQVPNEEEALKLRQDTLADALFALAKIYHYKLKEDGNARETAERFINDFPEHSARPEALLLLVRICKDFIGCQPDAYAQMLQKDYAESIYARMLNDTTANDAEGISKEVTSDILIERSYAESYKLYEIGNYQAAADTLAKLNRQHPNNIYSDKIYLLESMIIAKNGDLDTYINRLESFPQRFPQSEAIAYSVALLESAKRVKKGD